MTADSKGPEITPPGRSRFRSPMSWDTPHGEPPETRWYDPRFLAWLLVDLMLMAAAYCWHKFRSLRADRWAVEYELARAIRTLHSIETDEDVRPFRRQDAREAREALVGVAHELSIESRHIEPYRTTADTSDTADQENSDDAN